MFDPPREDADYQPLAEDIQPGGYDFGGQGGEPQPPPNVGQGEAGEPQGPGNEGPEDGDGRRQQED